MPKSIALGTIVKQGTTVIAGVDKITVPSPTKSDVDVTDFASTAAEFLPGLIDYGSVSLGGLLNYADAGQTILRADANDPAAAAKAFTVEFTKQAFKVTFNAYVKSYTPEAGGPNEAYKFTSELRVTGAATIAALP